MAENFLLLAGDIGGTKSNLAVFSSQQGVGQPLAEVSFASANYPGLEEMVSKFLKESGFSIAMAGFGVAGPVINNRAKITKLPWHVDGQKIKKRFGFSEVVVVNDLVATAYGLAVLNDSDLVSVNQGAPVKDGARAIMAPGTGLGEAFMIWDGSVYQACPSEGGHGLLAPLNDLQDGLLRYLRQEYDYVSYDRVCCGHGLTLIYDFLLKENYAPELDWVAAALSKERDAAPVITKAALGPNSSPLCSAALDMFVALLATEAASLSLKVLATGGLFIGGGIAPLILPFLQSEKFTQAFIGLSPHRQLLAEIPVKVVMSPRAALLGAGTMVLNSRRRLV